MKNLRMMILVAAALSASTPLVAQSGLEVGAHYVRLDPSGSNRFDDADAELELDNGSGYGVSLGLRLSGRWSVQAAIASTKSEASIRSDVPPAGSFPLGELKLVPVTATVRLHLLGDARLDPYIGAGASWTSIDSLEGDRLSDLDLEEIEFDDEVSYVAEAGLRVRISERFLLEAGAKYIPVTSDSVARFIGDAGPGSAVEVELNPIVITGGLIFRF